MPVTTWVENGCLVGYAPTGQGVRIPLAEIGRAAGVELGYEDAIELSGLSGATIEEALMGLDDDPVGADVEIGADDTEVGRKKKAARKAKRKKRRAKVKKAFKKVGKAVKKVAKNKIFRGIAKVVGKVVPPPFNVAIKAAKGAAKFARKVKKNRRNPKIKKAVALVRKAGAGKMTGRQLSAAAKRIGMNAAELNAAAVVKRVALQSARDPRARAALKLAKDVTSTSPLRQDLALAAAAQAQAGPNARAFVVQAPGGDVYRTLVQQGA